MLNYQRPLYDGINGINIKHQSTAEDAMPQWSFCGSRITSLQIRQRKDSCSTEPSWQTHQKSFHPPRQFSWSTTVVKTDKSQAENKRKAINLGFTQKS